MLQASDADDPNKWFCAAGHDQATCPPGAEGLLVPKGRLWVMGDHRGESADSRFHYTDSHQGTIPESRVVGRAFVVVYPIGRAGMLTVPSTFTTALARPGSIYVLGAVGALPLTLIRRRRETRLAA